jgi:hypothetical protein
MRIDIDKISREVAAQPPPLPHGMKLSYERTMFGRWKVYVTDARRTQWIGTVKTPELAKALADWIAGEIRREGRPGFFPDVL